MVERTAVSQTGAMGYVAVGLLFAAAILALLHGTAWAIVDTWYESNAFNHGFLIIPICLYLAWTRRDALAEVTPRPNYWGVLLVVLAALAWLAGHATGTLVVQEFSLVAILQASFLTIYGWPVVRALIFPLLYLYLAVPVGEALIPPLERVTAFFSVELLQIVGVPVFSDGNLISVPTGNFYVADACAGLRYLISSIALGILFSGLIFRTWWRRALFLLISIVAPIVANGIRAFGIILLAYLTNNEVAVGVDHIIYGWFFFALVTFLILAFGMAIRERDLAAAGPTARMPAFPVSPAVLAVAGILVLLPIVAAKAYGDYIDRAPTPRSIHLSAPELVGSYRKLTDTRDPQAPALAAPDAEADATYEGDGRTLYLHVGYYLRERRGAEAAGSGHQLFGKGWFVSAISSTSAVVGGERTSVQVEDVVSGKRRRLIWYWYWVDGRFTGNPYLAKLLQAKAKLIGGSQASAIIVVAVDYDDTLAAAGQSLRDFAAGLTALAPALSGATPG